MLREEDIKGVLEILEINKHNLSYVSRYRNIALYGIYNFESFDINLSGLYMFIKRVDQIGISVGSAYYHLLEIYRYFHNHGLNSKVMFVIDHYLDNDEFILHGYHLPEFSIDISIINALMQDLKIQKRGNYLLNLESDAHPIDGLSLFRRGYYKNASFSIL